MQMHLALSISTQKPLMLSALHKRSLYLVAHTIDVSDCMVPIPVNMVQLELHVILTTLWIISPPLSLAENHMQVTHEKVIHTAMFANFLVEIWGKGGGPPFL